MPVNERHPGHHPYYDAKAAISSMKPNIVFHNRKDWQCSYLASKHTPPQRDSLPQVELQGKASAHCFYPVVTMRALVAILLAVSCPYTVLKDRHAFERHHGLRFLPDFLQRGQVLPHGTDLR